jgi:hypothetical protein
MHQAGMIDELFGSLGNAVGLQIGRARDRLCPESGRCAEREIGVGQITHAYRRIETFSDPDRLVIVACRDYPAKNTCVGF